MPAVTCDPAKKRSHRHAILSELREQQEIAMADLRDPKTKPQVRSMLMRAYVELQKQRNVEKMRPAPKPIDVGKPTKQRRPSRAHVDAAPVADAAHTAPHVET